MSTTFPQISFSNIIVAQTPDYFIINKPAGIAVHGDGRSTDTTISDLILAEFPEMAAIGDPEVYMIKGEEVHILRPGIVHRLDKDTSGIMVVARTPEFFFHIKDQFQKRRVQKIYHTFVCGHLRQSRGTVSATIARHPSDIRRYSAGRGKVGEARDAETIYRTVHAFLDEHDEKYAFLEISPKTGRTHQIRVHMQYLQHSLVGDVLYSPKDDSYALGFSRMALHAKKISFMDLARNTVSYEAPYPVDFVAAIAKYVNI